MLIDLFATLPHYADHLLPIWKALPDDVRGDCWAGHGSASWGPRRPRRWPDDRLLLVAGFQDVKAAGDRRVVYVEHGAGQQYAGDPAGKGHQSYPGGWHPENVVGYIAPGPAVAAAWARVAPDRPVAAVGCPRLDPWLSGDRGAPGRRTLAVTWHWNCHLVPETMTALPHYRRHLGALVASWQAAGWEVLGHGHPRAWGQYRRMWEALGVEAVQSSAEVFDRAGLLLADNTSLVYEFTALDRPVVLLNAPWYRRDVHHGLRFWQALPGAMVDDADELGGIDLARYVDEDPTRPLRHAVAELVYAHRDGSSTARAAAWLAELAGRL